MDLGPTREAGVAGARLHDGAAAPAPAPPRWRRTGLAAIALVAVAVYARTYSFELVWDDPLLLGVIGQRVREGGVAGLLSSQFHLDLNEQLGFYRPVVYLSLWADSLLAPHLPQVYHLTNILLHAAVCLAVALFYLRVAGKGVAWFLGALFFAVHPAHCEAVAFVSGRTDLWAALFTMGAALAWARHRAGGAPAPLLRWAHLAAFVLATLSKEVAYVLPAVLLVWDALQPAPDGAPARGWWERNRFCLVGWSAVVAGGVALRWAVADIPYGFASPGATAAWSSAGHSWTLPVTVVTYLRLLAIPWPLNSYYTAAEVVWNLATLAGAGLATGVFLAATAKLDRRAGLLALAWAAMFLIPVLKLVPAHIGAALAERFLYLPAVGFCLALGVVLDGIGGLARRREAALAAAGVVVVAFGAATVARQGVWRDSVALFRDQMVKSPAYVDPYNNLGHHYFSAGNYQEAVVLFERAVALAPDYELAYLNLGNARMRLGRFEPAIEAYRQAIRVNPGGVLAHYNLGNAYQGAGRSAEAVASYERALQLDPGHQGSLNNLARAYISMGEHAKAREILVRMGTLDSVVAFRLSHGLFLASRGQTKEAMAEYEVLKGLSAARADELLGAIFRSR